MYKQLAVATALLAATAAQAVTLVQWDFENTIPDKANSTTSPSVAAKTGTGTANGVHTSPATDWTTPIGNGSENSLSSQTWAVGDYYQFSFSTVGYKDLVLSFDQTSSSTGPGQFSLAYSSNGTTFTPFADYSVLQNGLAPNASWSSGTAVAAYGFSFDLSAVSSLDNQSNAVIRLISRSTVAANGGVVQPGGTNRVDNFTVNVSAVPEPGTYAMLMAGLATVGFVARRRRG